MPRFYLPPGQVSEPTLFLAGREAHHALRVLRVRLGETVIVLDGAGHEYACRVEQYDRDKVKLTIEQTRQLPPPACQITLFQALPKGKLFDAIIQKATELGVSRIVPIVSERVVAAPGKAKELGPKLDKWRLTAVEAIKQCGSGWLPEVETPATPQQILARQERFDLALVASLQTDARHPRQYLSAFEAQHGRRPASACVWIGPEGDFSPSEVTAIQSSGAKPISLGPLILRTETAAIYCLSIINYEMQVP